MANTASMAKISSYLESVGTPKTVAQISKEVGLVSPTVKEILAMLEKFHFVKTMTNGRIILAEWTEKKEARI